MRAAFSAHASSRWIDSTRRVHFHQWNWAGKESSRHQAGSTSVRGSKPFTACDGNRRKRVLVLIIGE